jgi:hypothetical protein
MLENYLELINSYLKISTTEKKLMGEVFTPFALIEELLDTLPKEFWENKDQKILDPCNGIGNFPAILIHRFMDGFKHPDGWETKGLGDIILNEEERYKWIVENMLYICELQPKNMFIYLRIYDPDNKYKMNFHRGSFLDEEFDDKMKEWNIQNFDLICGNPPYTQGAKLLYTYFTKKSLKYSNLVILVMPISLNSNHDKLKVQNNLIHKHSILLSNNVSHYFNVGVPNIHFVVLNKNINNKIPEKQNSLDIISILLPERKRLKFIAGNTECGETEEDPNGIEIVYKVLQNDNLIFKKIPTYKVKKSKNWTNSKYSVFVNVTPSKGKFNCAILENCKMTWTRKVFMIECDTFDEAKKIKNWLQSSTIINEINKMLKAKNNTYSVSLEMVNRLPYYE